jgi:hypothetical protein
LIDARVRGRRRRAVADVSPGEALEVYVRREDAERFIDEIRDDEPELAESLRIEERELETGGQNLGCWLTLGGAGAASRYPVGICDSQAGAFS